MVEEFKSYYAIIPANVRYNEKLNANAKLLYGEITALCNQEGYCWATNEYFADLYKVSEKTISRWVSDLKELKFINTKVETFRYNDGTVKKVRYIYIDNNGIIHSNNNGNNHIDNFVPNHIDENVLYNNTIYNNTLKNNTKKNINSPAKAEPTTSLIGEIIDYMNNCGVLENFKIKKTFSFNPKANSNVKIIKARINEDNTLDDFKDVIYHTYEKFIENEFKGLNGKSSVQYYRPSTLFSSENMEKYKNEYKNM